MKLSELNNAPIETFVETLSTIFEHSPWFAVKAVNSRPFETVEKLHLAMCDAVDAAPDEHRLALIKAHPDLAGKAALSGELTDESTKEQAGAGLDRTSKDEFETFHSLNDAYQSKFGFPFIIAVKGHNKTSILQAFRTRLENDEAQEKAEALKQIYRIAQFRLEDLIQL